MIFGIVIAATVLIGVVLWLGSGIAVGKSRLEILKDKAHFPIVSGFNLRRQEFEFPRDFAGEYNLVIVPFKQQQQQDVNTWIPAAQELERTNSDLVYYELPTIYELPILSRTFINEGMRAGIPDQTARERTVTLYLDKERFKGALEISSEDVISLFLVDRKGEIYWREEGRFNDQKIQDLISVLEELKN